LFPKEFLNNFYTKARIESEFGIKLTTINSLIRTKRFPAPDEMDGKTPYWHITTLRHFLSVYNKVQTAKNNYTLDFNKQREIHLSKAKQFVDTFNIRSAFEYREAVKVRGAISAPSPSTLFSYSITFEELLSVDIMLDAISVRIVNNLREKRTVKELAMIIGTTERTIYRKLNLIREAGYLVKSDSSGIWL
jgi:DNA-binding transcriptional ArsR family regulator